ncbi:hypothetical protein [Mycolicibacterium sp. 624]|uniref:hypothetical protein n=1 Tax=Mycolicibacterium sp. 624 TaxID=3156314 RepID=UPI003399C7A4
MVVESPGSDLITVEGNCYFPPSSVNTEAVSDGAMSYNCPRRGDAPRGQATFSRSRSVLGLSRLVEAGCE